MRKCFTNQSCLPNYHALFSLNNQHQKHNTCVEMIGDSENKVCISYHCMVQKLQITTKLGLIVWSTVKVIGPIFLHAYTCTCKTPLFG